MTITASDRALGTAPIALNNLAEAITRYLAAHGYEVSTIGPSRVLQLPGGRRGSQFELYVAFTGTERPDEVRGR